MPEEQSPIHDSDPQTRLERIRDELYTKLSALTADFAWMIPKPDILVSDRVKDVVTDQSLPWQQPDWSAIALHPALANHGDESVVSMAIASGMARNALLIDATKRVQGDPHHSLPENVREEVLRREDYTNHPWAKDKRLPLAALLALEDPTQITQNSGALRRQLIEGMMGSTLSEGLWDIHAQIEASLGPERLTGVRLLMKKFGHVIAKLNPFRSHRYRAPIGDPVFSGKRPQFGSRSKSIEPAEVESVKDVVRQDGPDRSHLESPTAAPTREQTDAQDARVYRNGAKSDPASRDANERRARQPIGLL